MKRRLVAALACRNGGKRLFGKPLQNLNVQNGIRIIDHIIEGLKSLDCIDSIVLGISEGEENKIFKTVAHEHGIHFIVGDEIDVLDRLILCGKRVNGTDIFRISSESPFLHYNPVNKIWQSHCMQNNDATFYDHIIDGCGFEIIKLTALETSHRDGEKRHRSEYCSSHIRENTKKYIVEKINAPSQLNRKDLRLTVDNPEDLVICRKIYNEFDSQIPQINIEDIISYLDRHQELKDLTHPFTEEGYSKMYL